MILRKSLASRHLSLSNCRKMAVAYTLLLECHDLVQEVLHVCSVHYMGALAGHGFPDHVIAMIDNHSKDLGTITL